MGTGSLCGNYQHLKIFFICGVPGHHMDAFPTWKSTHPMATYVGSANQGLGFYHVDIPDVQSIQWLNLMELWCSENHIWGD